jgi:hypothetical protein
MRKRKKIEEAAKTSSYSPTDPERSVLKRQIKRLESSPSVPRIKIGGTHNGRTLSLDHPDILVARGLLMEALGTADTDFGYGLINDLISIASGDEKIDEPKFNFMLSIIKGIKPNDQLEAMLAAQMAAVHVTAMKFVSQFSRVETLQQQDSAERAFNKLTRTFTTQMEALKRYRTGGEQRVTVQHVSVSEGGQAIVGNVTQGPPDAESKKYAKPTSALTDARRTPMPTGDVPETEPIAVRHKQKK